MSESGRVYLDHAASTDVLPEARQAWWEAVALTGNASSLHGSGRRLRRLLEESRESIAADLGARPSEVIVTSGGTEGDNLAVKGFAWAGGRRGRRRILASAVEHHAVLDPVAWLGEHEGFTVEWIPVDALGRVDPDDVRRRLDDDVALCTVMWANNEVGTIQPISQLAEACREAGVPFHTDAVQAIGQLAVRTEGIDSLAISGHKIGAPVGVGALILDRGAALEPLLHGGGQEREIRSGTVAVAQAAALAAALRIATSDRETHAPRMQQLADGLMAGIRSAVPDAVIHGDLDPEGRLPGNVHVSVPGCEGDALLMLLDAAGVECSTGSACTSGVPEPSHVLLAMGVDPMTARGSLRFSLGRSSTVSDVDAVCAVLPGTVERARRAAAPRLARLG